MWRLFGLLVVISAYSMAEKLNIVFWLEPVQQTELSEDIAQTLKTRDAFQQDIVVQDFELVVDTEQFAEDDDEQDYALKFCELLANDDGVAVVVDFTYQPWLAGIKLLQAHGVPYLRVGRLLSPFMHMFGEYLRQKDANDVVLIHQNERDKTEAVHHIVGGYPFRVLLVNGMAQGDIMQRLRRLRPSPSYYGVFARGNNMNSVFERIQRAQLFERAAEWHFVFLDTRDRVFKYRKDVEHATKFTLNARALCRALDMKVAYCMTGFTLERAMLLQIMRTLINLRQLNADWLPNVAYDCNATQPDNELPPPIDLMEHFSVLNFMNIVYENSISYDDSLDAIASLSYALNVSINAYSNQHEAVTDLAVWENGALRKINATISPARRFFRVSVAESRPWSYYVRDARTGEIALDERGQPKWQGFCIDFIATLAQKMNFDYELVLPASGKYGKRDEGNGRWDGIVGDLVRGETDFAVAALKMFSEREEYIDYIAPYYEQTGISIVMRKPVRQTSLFKFMTVLRLEVWLSIIASLVATAFMIWLLDKYSPYSARNNSDAYPYPCREFTLRESFWFALTSFTPQGGGEAPKAVSGRILVAAYWLFVVLMLATFTANLAAFLTVERMQTPVASLEQLARQSRINYTVVEGSDTHQYFMNMKFAEDTLYRMWKELALNASVDYHKYRVWDYPIKEQYGHILLSINASGPVRDAAEGFRKVNEHENADFAFIHDSSEIKYELTRNCNLTEVGEVFAEQPYAIAVQQGSHLADEFSYAILELQKNRYFEDVKAKHWNTSYLNCPLSDNQEGITLESLGGVFIATLFGLGLAMLTLGIEVLYYKRKATETDHVISVKPFDNADKRTTVAPYRSIDEPFWRPRLPSRSGVDVAEVDSLQITPPPSFAVATASHQPDDVLLRPTGVIRPRNRLRGAYLRREPTDVRGQPLPPYIE